MDARSTDVLLVIIEEYVNTAEPVGSKNITDKYSLGVSSATVRNEMHQLEKDGYITSLHTSSGRIPTDKGYRFYVNYLAEKIKQKEIEEKIYKLLRRIELEDIISNVFTKLFSNNPYTSMGVVKRKQAVIESFHLLNVGSETLLIVLILKNGYSTNRLLKEAFATNLDFEIISNFLGSYLPNKTLDTINEGGIDILDKLKPESQESLHKVLAETIDMLRDFEENELYVHGIENLMNFPDFKNLSEVKCIFDAFNKRYEITEFLLNTDNDAFSVSIGDEINRPELSKLSIAKHTYDIGREGKITFGIAGPTRMDYKAVMNSLNNIENILKGMLNL